MLGKIICEWRGCSASIACERLTELLSRCTDDEHTAKVQHNLGVALRQMNRVSEALPHLLSALAHRSESHPESLKATLCEMCLCHLTLRNDELARGFLNQALNVPGKMEPENAAAFAIMAYLLGAQVDGLLPVTDAAKDGHELRLRGVVDVLTKPAHG